VTRSVHFEIDIANPDRALPAGATARVRIEVGEPRAALRLPLVAATVRGTKATLFSVTDGKAHRIVVPVLGERDGDLFIDGNSDAKLAERAAVVVEGRGLLDDGDAVSAQEAAR
jgi:multidrug efflux pump subunit AcrA (membrane-fusion protein)